MIIYQCTIIVDFLKVKVLYMKVFNSVVLKKINKYIIIIYECNIVVLTC